MTSLGIHKLVIRFSTHMESGKAYGLTATKANKKPVLSQLMAL